MNFSVFLNVFLFLLYDFGICEDYFFIDWSLIIIVSMNLLDFNWFILCYLILISCSYGSIYNRKEWK